MEVTKGDFNLMGTQGKYTIADIEALPEGQRAELFDGEMIMMASPTTTHQRMAGWLYRKIGNYIEDNNGKCEVFIAPFAVYIKKDIWNYFEPDLVVICDGERLDNKGCHGAPDMVIEVVSPGSRKLDYERKLAVYIETGVREYWIVDPIKRIITVYHLEESKTPVVYPFGAVIAVGIYPDLQIDTASLAEMKVYQ